MEWELKVLDFIQNNHISVVKYFFENSSPNRLFEFLSSEKLKQLRSHSVEHVNQLEELFQDIDQPLVNLGLACYGGNMDVVRNLFHNAPHEVRLAILARRDLFLSQKPHSGSVLNQYQAEAVLLNGSLQEQQAILQNPHFSSILFHHIYAKTGNFSSISDERLKHLIRSSIGNIKFQIASFSEATDKNKASDSDVDFRAALRSAWALSLTVPVDDSWAIVLMGLYESLIRIENPFDDIGKAIERWRGPAQNAEHSDAYESIRMNLADLIDIDSQKGKNLKESDDIALRQSFYKRFSPANTTELEQFYAKDHDRFIFWALSNKDILSEKKNAEKLKDLCKLLDSEDTFYQTLFQQRASA